ncbi:MAG: glycosyltransferase, partial [Deltaproteobacteria bacterium]|nr:glycosyltransferase [Deltaproteobacteria bacterium]
RRETAAACALVLNYDAVSLGAVETRPYFCLLTGTDLVYFANPCEIKDQFVVPDAAVLDHYPNRAYIRNWIAFCLRQRSAIRQAEGYSFFPSGCLPWADEVLAGIGAAPERRLSFLLTETEALEFSAPRRGDCLRVLYGARLTWDRTSAPYWSDLDYKGSDIFLRGFAEFVQQGGKAELTLFRKGDHIRQTEELVTALGLSASVRWNDELSQRDFLEAVRATDVTADQIGASHIGMVTIDSMSLGRPVIATAPDYNAWNWPTPLPICHADNAGDVAAWLGKLAGNPAFYGEIASRARSFAEEHFSPVSTARRLVEALRQPASRQEVPLFQTLALCEIYDEKNYAAQLALQAGYQALQAGYDDMQAGDDGVKAAARRFARAVSKKLKRVSGRFPSLCKPA